MTGRSSIGSETGPARSLFDELATSISDLSIASRAEALMRVTDLFIKGLEHYDERSIDLFGEIMIRLADAIETSVRARLAERVATIANAPPNLIRRLAFDDAIAVAGPVLSTSQRLSDPTLVENAQLKSQDHLLAISSRASLSEVVTDVLVTRGNHHVARRVAKNPGARFSDKGHRILVQRSNDDDELAVFLCLRSDLPRHHLVQLLAAASDEVRRRLAASAGPHKDLIADLVAATSNRIQEKTRLRSPAYLKAAQTVKALQQSGRLEQSEVTACALAGSFEDTVAVMAALCGISIELVERSMLQRRPELVMLLAKSAALSWATTKALLALRSQVTGKPAGDYEEEFASYARLHEEAARKAVHFLRLRERADAKAYAFQRI